MLSALLLAGALLSSMQGVKPPEYTERNLCHLWAGAQCETFKCGEDADSRCKAQSKRCSALPRRAASKERAEKIATCARAMLKQKCGDPAPAACADIPAGGGFFE